MSKKVVFIDGQSILEKANYGVFDEVNSEKIHINVVKAFINLTTGILRDEKTEYAAVVFDNNEDGCERKVLYDEYKANRKIILDQLKKQKDCIKEALEAMNIITIDNIKGESIDIIGSLCECDKEGDEYSFTVVTCDTLMLSLMKNNIIIRIPSVDEGVLRFNEYTEQMLIDNYGVNQDRFAVIKALIGDRDKNIKGISYIGTKTAAKIIGDTKNIDEFLYNVDNIESGKIRHILNEAKALIELNANLLEINRHLPVAEVWQEIISDRKTTGNVCDINSDINNNIFNFNENKNTIDSNLFRTITDLAELDDYFKFLKKDYADSYVGLELLCENNDLYGVGITDGENTTFIPVINFITKNYLINEINSLSEAGIRFVCVDLIDKLDYINIKNENAVDIGIYAYLINPIKDKYDYIDIAKEYLQIELQPIKENIKGKTFENADLDTLKEIACTSAYICYNSYAILNDTLDKLSMKKLCEEIEMPLLYVLHDMHKQGIGVDDKNLSEYGEKLVGRIEQLENEIYELALGKFNINSPKQLGEILFERLQLEGGKKTKTGYSTSAEVLEKLIDKHPIIEKILEYRTLSKLNSTYVVGLKGFIKEDGRIHSNFNQTITATGRISSTEPNLQNIPIRMELGRQIRKVFVAKEGYVFLDADYSQIELRILAHMSGDEKLIEAYNSNEDIHKMTASQVFHVPLDEVTPQLRRNAKAVNFGIVYGISSFGLSQDLSITKKEAGEYIERYFVTYPGIKKYLDELVSSAKETGYAITMYGRRRPVPELSAANFMQRSFGERVAMNSPIQGSAADIIKIAMIRVYRRLKEKNLESKLILQIHDELLIETKLEELEEVKEILAQEMKHAAKLKVELEIDMHSGKDWYEAK